MQGGKEQDHNMKMLAMEENLGSLMYRNMKSFVMGRKQNLNKTEI